MNSWYLSLWTPIAGGRWVGRKRERGREGNGEGGKGGEGREEVREGNEEMRERG